MDQKDQYGKRKASSEDFCSESETKRAKCEDGSSFELLSFSDCVLLQILGFCDATSLFNLSQVCERLRYLVDDDRLWVNVDTRRCPNSADKIKFCEKHLNARTVRYLTCSDRTRSVKLLSDSFCDRADLFSRLTVLALENQTIDGTFCLRLYPKTLQEISFRKSYITKHKYFFRHTEYTLKDLRVLIMDQCQWLEPESLLPFATLPNLEILSLYMCKKFADDQISYISLCGMFGFKKLKVLNVRFTGLGDQLISVMSHSKTLQQLYFQSYCLTYRADRFKRKLDISRGAAPLENSYLSDDEENNEMDCAAFCKKYGKGDYYRYYMDGISEVALYYFNDIHSSLTTSEPPKKSVLFRAPYEACNCGWTKNSVSCDSISSIDKNKEKAGPSTEIINDEQLSSEEAASSDLTRLKQNYLYERKLLRHKLDNYCVPYVLFVQLPMGIPDVIEATRENKNRRWISFREPLNDYEISMLEHTHSHLFFSANQHEPTQCFVVRLNDGSTSEASSPPFKNVVHYDPDDPSKTDKLDEVYDEKRRNKVAQQYIHISCKQDVAKQNTSNIKRLSLRGYSNITDSALAYLNNLDLELLDVTYTSVTKKGVLDYLKSHPDCRVLHESACTCNPTMHF